MTFKGLGAGQYTASINTEEVARKWAMVKKKTTTRMSTTAEERRGRRIVMGRWWTVERKGRVRQYEKRREILWKVDVNNVGDEYLKRICDWPEFQSRGWGLLIVDGKIQKHKSLRRQQRTLQLMHRALNGPVRTPARPALCD